MDITVNVDDFLYAKVYNFDFGENIGTGRFYYWNTETDKVAWLPPKHPKCVILDAASVQRVKELKKLQQTLNELTANKVKHKDKDNDNVNDKGYDSDEDYSTSDRLSARLRSHKMAKKEHRMYESKLDPMDPAAYSDIPRGTWSSGLNNSPSDNKSGVDSTAHGNLYQMRPYPSPGAVLEMNKSRK